MSLEEAITPDNPSWNRIFYGEAIANAMEKFNKCLSEVETRHQDYFDALTEEAEEQNKPVRLHNFTLIQWNNQGLQMAIKPELRADIAAECRACVKGLS